MVIDSEASHVVIVVEVQQPFIWVTVWTMGGQKSEWWFLLLPLVLLPCLHVVFVHVAYFIIMQKFCTEAGEIPGFNFVWPSSRCYATVRTVRVYGQGSPIGWCVSSSWVSLSPLGRIGVCSLYVWMQDLVGQHVASLWKPNYLILGAINDSTLPSSSLVFCTFSLHLIPFCWDQTPKKTIGAESENICEACEMSAKAEAHLFGEAILSVKLSPSESRAVSHSCCLTVSENMILASCFDIWPFFVVAHNGMNDCSFLPVYCALKVSSWTWCWCSYQNPGFTLETYTCPLLHYCIHLSLP